MYIPFMVIILIMIKSSIAVDTNNFKTCEESSFCRRGRKVQLPGHSSKFALVPGTINTFMSSVTADLINKHNNHTLILKLEALVDNTFRLQVDEKNPLRPRYRVQHALDGKPKLENLTVQSKTGDQLTIAVETAKVVIHANPFKIDFYENNVLSVSVNAKNWMHFEHIRQKTDNSYVEGSPDQNKKISDSYTAKQSQEQIYVENYDSGAWEENFKSHHDSKPYGPEAVALDFTFSEAEVMFGIPEHADNFILKSTSGTDPYRLYNLDVFEYVVGSKMALYGSVPVLYAHGKVRTAGVFWQNGAETWVDIINKENNVVSSIVKFVSGSNKSDPPAAHFISESGIIDAFIMLGPTPIDTFKQYTKLTGTANLPQMFSLGYHQCRWNYNDEKDVMTVSSKFDEYNMPMDTMWLDIEYTDGKKYFTWDKFKFPNPLSMIKNLTERGRHLVIIIDPHIKRDVNYFFHNECTNRGYYIKTRDGNDYEGWCWPGSASYPDFFNPEVRDYYADQYSLSNFKTVTADVMIWNDMNEPSIFNGPEVTAPKDLVHFGNWEHRDLHNIYGHMQLMGTFNGLLKRDSTQRPFILTRAHFAGSQRYAAVWTGDNLADWSHLQYSIKMCISEAVAGISFCGADVGGFFGNPNPELMERWYQAGAFLPFYRSHAHIDTKRREPWVFPKKTRIIIGQALQKRYSYLPLWYTAFYEHEKDGSPVIRPLLTQYPQDKDAFRIDNSFLVQDRLIVCPVMQQGVKSIDVYFPVTNDMLADYWYDIDNYQRYANYGYERVSVTDSKVPVYQRGGSIVPKKERLRRTATLMKNDPYTLIVCLDRQGKAQGTLYVDDEKSFNYRKGEYIYANYSFSNNELVNHFMNKPNYETESWIERIVIAGLSNIPKSASVTVYGISRRVEIIKHQEAVIIRKPGVKINVEFILRIMY